MQKTQLSKIILSIIFIIVSGIIIFLRLYGLGNTPQGLTQDEAYYLYDAFSIHETGNDIHGQKSPLVFESTGEYKLNLPYLVSISIDAVGLNTAAVRLPSAFFGLLSLIVIGLIVYQYTSNMLVSTVSPLILALSPWHFGISRLFYEANVGIFFLSLAFYFAIKILKGRSTPTSYLIMGALAACSAYFYGPYRYLGFGLLALTLLLSQTQSLRSRLKHSLITLVVYFAILTPLLLQLGTTQSLTRLAQETKLHQFGYELKIDEARMNCYLNMNRNDDMVKLCYAFWNKPLLFAEQAVRTATRLLSPEYLFQSSVDDYIVPTSYGAYSSYLLPFYLLGIYLLIKKSSSKKHYLLLSLSLLSALAVPSIIGEVVYHRNVYGLLITFIIIALGLSHSSHLLRGIKNKYIVIAITTIFSVFAIFQHAKYVTHYYTTHTIQNPLLFRYDAPEIFEYLEDYQDYTIYDNIFFAPIYAGIYWRLDPADFQQNAIWADPDDWGFSNAQRWNNIYLTEITLNNLLCLKHADPDTPLRSLIIDDPGKYNEIAVLLTHDFSGSLTLHAVYDIDVLYPFVLSNYPQDLCELEN